MEHQNFEKIIKNKTSEYYASNSKNIIFKNKQKIELAKSISEDIDLSSYLKELIYIDNDNTSHIFIIYNKVKVILNPDNYKFIVSYIDNLIISILNNHETYCLHVDIFSLTISGVNRIRPFIMEFLCLDFDNGQRNRITDLSKIFIYNSPNVITTIRTIIEPLVRNLGVLEKVVYVNNK